MISWLKGHPQLIGQHFIVVVHGVGYGVEVGTSTAQRLGSLAEVELFIHTHVREDQLSLFGFATYREKEVFVLLLDVSGVGPRIALAIVDRGAESLVQAVQTADVKYFTSIPRVGTKLAQKIIIELKGKLGSLQELSLGPRSQLEQDLVAALQSLGFDEAEIYQVLPELPHESSELKELLKQAMKLLGKPR